ncbi:MAG: phosphotransferase family protein [Pseudonocardiaceae bacterium]
MAVRSIAPDDIVRTDAELTASARPPLVVVEPLLEFLDAHGIGGGEPEFRPVGEGVSNVTYLVDRGGARFVLRRPPRPPLPPSAHDVLREARVLRALAGRARVPEVLAVCDDPVVIGAPFYVMAYVDGHVVTDMVPAELDSVEQKRRIAEDLIVTLVEIHAVDWQAAGLEGFGKPTGYLERQVRRFIGLWEFSKTRELPAVERVADWLTRNLPESRPATIVHGDYRLGNTMVAPGAPARIVAVFDWEMSTLGDPLADLGYLCSTWTDRNDPPGGSFELSKVTREEGFPTRDELVTMYAQRSGRPVEDIRWYRALALWKAVVFMEGNYKRAISGTIDNPFLEAFRDGVVELAERAEATTRGK